MGIYQKKHYNSINFLKEKVEIKYPIIDKKIINDLVSWNVLNDSIFLSTYINRTKNKVLTYSFQLLDRNYEYQLIFKEVGYFPRFFNNNLNIILEIENIDSKFLVISESGNIINELHISKFPSPVFFDNNNVYCVSNHFVKKDFKGDTKWEKQVNKSHTYIAAYDDKYIFCKHNNFTTSKNDNTITCFSQSDGSIIWQKEIDQIKHHVPILLFKNLLLLENTTNEILCLEASSGKILWNWLTNEDVRINRKEAFKGKINTNNLDKISDIRTYTLDYEGVLHILDFDQYIQVDIETGTVLQIFELAKAIKKLKLEIKKNVSPETYLGPSNRPSVSTTHFIVSIMNYVVFINKQTGIIDYTYQLEEKEGRVEELSIIGENRIILIESGYKKKNRGGSYSIWKVLESSI